MADVSFRPNISGIREILHSGGVKAELQSHADRIANACNAQAEAHYGPLEVPAYWSAVNDHRNVAVGRVFTASKMGRLDERHHHTLEANNH